MPYIRLTHNYIYAGQLCSNVYHYASPTTAPTPQIMTDLADDFMLDVMGAINQVQVQQVSNVSVVAYAPNVGYSIERTAAGGGLLASVPAGNIPPDIALLVERSLGSTRRNDNGQPYTGNRPIRRGHFFLSGLPKDCMEQSGFVVAGFALNWTAFANAMVAALDVDGLDTWTPCVVGQALAATLTKDARPIAYAPITGVTTRQFTNLDTRDV